MPYAGWALMLATLSAAPGASSSPLPPLYMITYDHGGVILWGVSHFEERLRDAVSWLDKYPGFKIGLDNEAYTYDYLAEASPSTLAEIRGYLARYPGRFGIGTCTYGQPLSVFINEESNVRQIGYALAACRKHLGVAPPVYLMSEHAMHSQIPQLLKGFGFTGSIMRTHFMMYGYNPTFDVPTGWWVGVDGSRIPTVPTYNGEGSHFGRTTVDNWILTRYPGPECSTPLETYQREFARINPLLASRADDSGLRREELVKQYEGKPGYKWILLEELFRSFPAPKAELKTPPNSFVVRMPWGYCGNEIWNGCRAAEVGVLTAERLAALEYILGGSAHEAELEAAWKNLLVAQHHDIQICGLLDDARRFIPASRQASQGVADASMRYVASRMKGGPLLQVTGFNPLSWRRKEWLQTEVSLPQGAAHYLRVQRNGTTVTSYTAVRESYPDGSIKTATLGIDAELPPLGFRSFGVSATTRRPSARQDVVHVDPKALTISTPFAIARLNSYGGIASLVAAGTGKPLLAPGRRSCFFAGTIEGQNAESRGTWQLNPSQDGGEWATATERGEIAGIPYTLQLTFRADTPRIECRASFTFSGQRIGQLSDDRRDGVSGFIHEQKLRLKLFPATGPSAVGIRDLPFVVAETPDRYVEGIYWTAVADADGGLAVFNRGNMGSVRESDGGFSVSLAYAMHYIWGTRMLAGQYQYELALYPFRGKWQDADIHRQAIEYNMPPVSLCSEPGDGSLGDEVRAVDAGSLGVLVSAMYPEAGHVYVRMYEYRGRDSSAAVSYLSGKAAITEVDLAGREIKPAPATMAFGPWRIRTVRIDPQRQ